MITAKAIEIITDDGYGIPINLSHTAIGLVSGHLLWIDGRNGLDGSKTIAGDTARTVWYQNILADGGFAITRAADMIQNGMIAQIGTLEFSVVNTKLFFNILKGLTYTDSLGNSQTGIDLYRCRVKSYYVESTDGATFTFNQRGLHLVDEQPFNELAYKFVCIDAAKTLLESIPMIPVGNGNYPEAPQNQQQNNIPITMGRVAYSPLVMVSSGGAKIQLAKYADDPSVYTACSAISYTSVLTAGKLVNTLYLLTVNVSFGINAANLVNNWLNVIAGGANQSIKILSNLKSVLLTFSSPNAMFWQTTVQLQEPFDVSTKFQGWPVPGHSASNAIWYFEIVRFNAILAVSQKNIEKFVKSPGGNNYLFTPDSNSSDLLDISEVGETSSTSNISKIGFPGFSIIANDVNGTGSAAVYFGIQPRKIVIESIVGTPSGSFPIPSDLNADCPNLYDRDPNTYYELSGGDLQVTLLILFDQGKLTKTFDAIYLLPDFSQYAGGDVGLLTQLTIWSVDVLKLLGTVKGASNISVGRITVGTSIVPLYLLPNSYYGLDQSSGRDDSLFYSNKSKFEATQIIDSVQKMISYPGLQLLIDVNRDSGTDNTLRLQQVGVVGRKVITFSNESIFATTIGEVFGSTWNSANRSRTISIGSPVLNFGDVIEKYLRDYGYPYPFRNYLSGTPITYDVGTKVKPAYDNGHIYLCTVGGQVAAASLITGCANNGSGLIRVHAVAHGNLTGNTLTVIDVLGTTEANGNWVITKIDADHYDLQGSAFVHAYTSGGIATVAWPTGENASVTDGAVTWTEVSEIMIDGAAFDALAAARPNDFCGGVTTDQKSLQEILAPLVAQARIGLFPDRFGKMSVSSWLDNQIPLMTFTEDNVFGGSFGDRTPSPMSRVSNCGPIRYDYNYATKQYNRQITIANIEQPFFPSQTPDLSTLSIAAAASTYTLVKSYSGAGFLYQFAFNTTDPHGYVSGDYASLIGCGDGVNQNAYDFNSLPVNVEDANNFYVYANNNPIYGDPDNAGVLYKSSTYIQDWRNYIGGLPSYPDAANLWNLAKLAFKIAKGKRPFTDAQSNCAWLIDPLAEDPNGNTFWSDSGGAYDITNSGTKHPAVKYATFLLTWAAWIKDLLPFSVDYDLVLTDGIHTAKDLKLYDCIAINDQKSTAGATETAWIYGLDDVPATKGEKEHLSISACILPPKLLASLAKVGLANEIIDWALAGDTIVDDASASDIIIDG